MKLGLFGGTFDPIHIGHLRCAEEILEMFELDRVVFIPAAYQPLKTNRKVLPFGHRETMINLAIAENGAFCLSDLEHRRDGFSYSIDTVAYFQEKNRGAALYFIIGEDAFQDITLWKEWKKLLVQCNFIVMTRPGYRIDGLDDILPRDFLPEFNYDTKEEGYKGPRGTCIYFRSLTQLDISSTDIRNRRAAGKSVRYLVPETVNLYILENGLYHCTK